MSVIKMQHTDGDLKITLVEAPRGVYTVVLTEGVNSMEFIKTIYLRDAIGVYNTAVAAENSQYM